jgi:aminocarboxymuconate-semialdehyde decarboxylase
MKIDVHAHFFPRITREQGALLGADGPWLRDDGDGTGQLMAGEREYRPVESSLWDPDVRVARMDEHGVDIQVVSATPLLFGYGADPETAGRWCRLVNDQAVEMCAVHPERLRPLCQVPLQDVDLACVEASRAVADGHVGVHIGNHLADRNLDDPDMVQFLHHCADESIPVLVHPWDMMAADRMPGYMLQWLVGMPAETHLGILSLILSGAFERLPRGLRLCFAHGGGNFAAQLGRVDNAWHRRDLIRADCPNPPSTYVDRFSVDSAVFSDDALRLLVAVMGIDRVMLGSDAPFPLGEEQPGRLVETSSHLSDDDRSAILGDNAVRFFGLSD